MPGATPSSTQPKSFLTGTEALVLGAAPFPTQPLSHTPDILMHTANNGLPKPSSDSPPLPTLLGNKFYFKILTSKPR